MLPEDRTTYATGDSPVKPNVMRARSPVRRRVFDPRPEGKQFRGYWDYYPEAPGISYSAIRPRFDPCQVQGDKNDKYSCPTDSLKKSSAA